METLVAVPEYAEHTAANFTSQPTQPHHRSLAPHHLDRQDPTPHPPPTPSISTVSANSRGSQKSPSRLSRWIRDWVTDWWGAEIACWIIASISLIAIVIVLESHKSKPLPEWPFQITINSLISVFATIGQMAMMKPVVECISQLKWLWLVRKEKLAHFQIFDDASRGPTGSLLLLGKVRGLHLISLGAAITVFSIAFGAFAQQVVTYPLYLRPVGEASVPLVLNYTGAVDADSASSPALVAAMFNGLANNNLTLSDITPSCSTGNCIWKMYPSLGICATVVDISASISENACNLTAYQAIFEAAGIQNPGYPCFNYTLPVEVSNWAVQPNGDTAIVPGNATLSNVVPFEDDPPSIKVMSLYGTVPTANYSFVNAYLMYQPDFEASINSSLKSPIAYELSLDLCVQTYNTTVSNGLTNTSIVFSQLFDSGETEVANFSSTSLGDFLVSGNTTASLSVGGIDFGMTIFGYGALSDLAQIFFVDDCFQQLNESGYQNFFNKNLHICQAFGGVGDSFMDGLLDSLDPYTAIEKIMGNIAISMTNTLRTGAGGDSQITQFQGTAFSPQKFVETEYVWLILPISLVSLTLIFLLATITKSQRLGSRVWKSSNLATLQGLHQDLHTHLGGLTSISEMEEKANAIKVRFDMEGGKAQHGLEYRLVESKQHEYWKG